MSEFEERESGLGELPEDISGSTERDELKYYGKDGSAHVGVPPYAGGVPSPLIRGDTGVPTDIAAEHRIRSIEGKIASPGIPANVTSVYDARLINGRDFLHTQKLTITADAMTPASSILTATAEFEIPQGFTGVLRGFSYQPHIVVEFTNTFYVDTETVSFVPITSTLLIDELVIPDYNLMDLGQSVEFNLPLFSIATAGQKFKLRLTYDVDVAIAAICVMGAKTFHISTQLYGNLLLSRGLPREFEIATQNFSGSVK